LIQSDYSTLPAFHVKPAAENSTLFPVHLHVLQVNFKVLRPHYFEHFQTYLATM